MLPIDLTDEEIDLICDGLTQNAAMIRFLTSHRLTVRRKPNGRPLVNRQHYVDVMRGPEPGRQRAAEPSWTVET